MKHYTGRDRVMAAYNRQYADRVPIDILGLTVGNRHLKYTPSELATDPQKQADVLVKSWEMIQSDIVTTGALSMQMAMAAGNECDVDEQGTLYPKKRILEKKANLIKISPPDPKQHLPLPFVLEICDLVGTRLAKAAGVRGIVSQPWTVAVQMRGLETLIYDTQEDPDFVHDVMRFCTDYTKTLGTAVVEAIGEEGIGLYTSDPSAGCSILSPKIYREFVKPYHEEVVHYFKQRETLISFHICGYLDPIMEDIVSIGVDGVSIDEKSSLEKMFEISNGKTVVLGNISTLLFLNGTAAEIEAAVKECLRIAKGKKGYILASGCGIPPQTPIENLKAFMAAAEKYGGYDSDDSSLNNQHIR